MILTEITRAEHSRPFHAKTSRQCENPITTGAMWSQPFSVSITPFGLTGQKCEGSSGGTRKREEKTGCLVLKENEFIRMVPINLEGRLKTEVQWSRNGVPALLFPREINKKKM
ncbi:hypothetical protein AVEN_48805-1 [Araneus ventricosus]|uniref:Uncharacterized protein n=1 Tax=Araneus ventricosus TaxID=182803 RepID=A0A4Y2IG11_ARAVE|nr:hypothetical protein AVEN_48805-1 [Araneus ventricosus]